MKTILNSKTSAHKSAIKILSALALAAAIQFSPSKLAAEMGLRGGSAIPTSAIGAAPVSTQFQGQVSTGDRDSARTAIRQIEADARELYNTSSRELRNGSRDEVNALNRVNDLQRAAYDLTVTLDRRDITPAIADSHYRAFMTSYESARGSWSHLGRVRGASAYTVRMERSFTPVRGYCAPSYSTISWYDVRRTADKIEDAADHLYEVAYRESKGYGDYRTRESRRVALEHMRELRETARDFDRYIDRASSDPRHSRDEYRDLVRAMERARGAVRVFGHHAAHDFDDVQRMTLSIGMFYADRHDHGHDRGRDYGHDRDHSSYGGSWDRRDSGHTSVGGSVRVYGSTR